MTTGDANVPACVLSNRSTPAFQVNRAS